MRLLSLSPNPRHQHISVVAMDDSANEDGCYHYQVARNKNDGTQESFLSLVIASPQASDDEDADGITIEGLLAICEDQARLCAPNHPTMGRVAHQLQAAMRVLAAEHHDRPSTIVSQGEVQHHATT